MTQRGAPASWHRWHNGEWTVCDARFEVVPAYLASLSGGHSALSWPGRWLHLVPHIYAIVIWVVMRPALRARLLTPFHQALPVHVRLWRIQIIEIVGVGELGAQT